jgi:chorismate synthase
MFSIPAVKGIEFGMGFEMADKFGSEVNDSFCVENGNVVTTTNNNGGINGGITNGMPVVFRCVVKPTPSIYKEQKTVNMAISRRLVDGKNIFPVLKHKPTA